MPSAPRRPVSVLVPWAAALVVGLGAGGWSLSERRLREQEAAEARQTEENLRQELAARDKRVSELEERVHTGSPTEGIAIWPLRGGIERGTASEDSFTVDGDWVRLRIPLDHDPGLPSYRASLQTANGKEIHSLGGLTATSRPGGRTTVDFMVPAAFLQRGTYLLSIQRDESGRAEELELTATYFVVR